MYDVVIHLPEMHFATLITGVVCLILLIVLEHYFHKIPAALVALIFGILISVVFGLEACGVEIVVTFSWSGATPMAGSRLAKLVASLSRCGRIGFSQFR